MTHNESGSNSRSVGNTEQSTESLPDIGIGTYDMTPETCTSAVRTALACGYRHVDTAEMYGTESLVARAIEGSPVDTDEVFVATKVHSKNLAYEAVPSKSDESSTFPRLRGTSNKWIPIQVFQ